MAEFDHKEYARQMRENCAKDQNGNIICSAELWEQIASIIESTADVVPKSEVEKQKVWIFDNSPFEMLDIAFKRLFPNVKYTAFFEPNIRDDEHGEKVCGLTDFADDGEITIFIDTDLSINDAVEIFAHELAHAGVGVEQEHNQKWQKAFDDLFNEYNKIGDEMFGSNIDAPKGESYSNALSEIEKIKQEVAREIFEDIRKTCGYSVAEHNGVVLYHTKCYSIMATKLDELEKKFVPDTNVGHKTESEDND